MMNKILPFLIALLPLTALAVQISVPSAPTNGYFLISNTTGNYVASSSPSFSTICIAGDSCRTSWPSYTATYPITLSGTAFGIAFGTTTANTWSATQTFTSVANFNSWTNNGNGTTTTLSLTGLLSKTMLATDGIGRIIAGSPADTATDGYLTSTDWNTFNGKESVLTFTYPLQRSTNTISLTFGTTTNNVWGGQNTFLSSTTLQNFTGTNATTTSATSTNLFATTLNAITASTTNLTAVKATTTNATTTAFSVSSNHITIGTNSAYLTGTTSPAFNIASTTLDAMGKSFNIGTTTLLMKNWPMAYTLDGFYCVASTTGTAIVNFSHDNGNKTEYSICTTGGYTRTATNNTFTAFENFNVQASSTAGTVNRITITTVGHYTSD